MVMERVNVSPQKPKFRLIGEILQAADLISANQIAIALEEQSKNPGKKIGEILASKGWIRQETVDFFAQEWKEIVASKSKRRQELGYYLRRAALLNEEQIAMLVDEQRKGSLWIRLGALATIKGLVNQSTIDFFLQHLYPEQARQSAFVKPKKLI